MGTTSKSEHEAPVVLLIEDNHSLADITARVLEEIVPRVIVATTAQGGIEAVRTHSPDIIHCDLCLDRGATGIDVAVALRKERLLENRVLVALTAFDDTTVRAETLEAGFDAFLPKPFELEQIEEILQEWQQRKKVRQE